MATFGPRLQAERQRIGLTQAEFAARVGVGKSAQSLYEAGRRGPSMDYWPAAAAVGIDVLYVVLGERSTTKLLPDEQELLKRYNASLPVLRQAARSMLVPAESVPNLADEAVERTAAKHPELSPEKQAAFRDPGSLDDMRVLGKRPSSADVKPQSKKKKAAT